MLNNEYLKELKIFKKHIEKKTNSMLDGVHPVGTLNPFGMDDLIVNFGNKAISIKYNADVYENILGVLDTEIETEESSYGTLLIEAIHIKEAFEQASDEWQIADDPLGNDDHIGIVINGTEYHLSFFAADMFHIFGKFIETVAEEAEKNNW